MLPPGTPDTLALAAREVRSLLEEGQVEAAIKKLGLVANDLGPTGDTLADRATRLASSLASTRDADRKGTITYAEFEARQNKLVAEVLEALRSEADTESPDDARPTAPPAERPWLLKARGLSRRFGKVFRLEALDLTLRYGDVLGVVGFNGAGKSTLLRMLARDLAPTAGELTWNELDAADRPLEVTLAYVPQQPDAWTGSLREHLELQAAFHGYNSIALNDRQVDHAVLQLGLGAHLDKGYDALSGGFRMRAAIAAAVLARPRLMVLDEPLAPLDPLAQESLLQWLRTYASHGNGCAVVLSSQHVPEVESVADAILLLDELGPRLVKRGHGLTGAGRDFKLASHDMAALLRRLDELAHEKVVAEVRSFTSFVMVSFAEACTFREVVTAIDPVELSIAVDLHRSTLRDVLRGRS